MSDRWTGRLIDGRYVVESIIGQGGMGVVLKARHKFTSAQVALKMLQPDLQMNEEAKERFLREAQTPTTIGHAGIVQVNDAGVTPEGELYIAMELLTGRTLRQAMYPSLPPQIARRILLELLDALGAAHARGIIHRDLKPENVFLAGPSNTVKLLDFGIAKMVQAGRTAAGMMLGTLSYMAPEQLSDASSVDARADLWAVGVMVYEMLTGKLPFRGTQLGEIMAALATQEPDPIGAYLPDATPAMKAFFASALCKDRNGRFGSAQDMAMSVSAMLIEGTAPPVISTLNGLGSPRSSQMTAADSGPSIPSRQHAAVSAPHPAVSGSQPAQHHAQTSSSQSAPQTAQSTPFGASSGSQSAPQTAQSTPFGASSGSHGAQPTPFGGASGPQSAQPTPFGASSGSQSAQSTPFGAGSQTANAPPFAPHVPPPGAPFASPPHVPPPGAPSGAHHASAPLINAPRPHHPSAPPPIAQPFSPHARAQGPMAAPAVTPNAPFTAAPGPGPYGTNPTPPHARPGYHPPTPGGMGSMLWWIIGGSVAVVIVLVLIGKSMMSGPSRLVPEPPNRPAAGTDCQSICSDMAKCVTGEGFDQAQCVGTCEVEPRLAKCWTEADGVCFAFKTCVEAFANP